MGEDLFLAQREDIRELEPQFQDVFSHIPHKVCCQAIGEEVACILREGIIEPSNSPRYSPIVIVPKLDSSLWLCIDFWRLNAISGFKSYPLPMVDDLEERLGEE